MSRNKEDKNVEQDKSKSHLFLLFILFYFIYFEKKNICQFIYLFWKLNKPNSVWDNLTWLDLTWLCITKTYLYNFDPIKPHFYIVKLGFTGVYIFSYFCSNA